ncbi:MAG TPA: class I SAM-dependent methyltransferase [Thermoanaerobaculia bacterium]
MTPFDLILGGVPRFEAEGPWAWRLARRFARSVAASRFTEVRGRKPVVADAAGDSPLVLVWAEPEAYLAPPAARRLVATLDAFPSADLVLPVSNEAWTGDTRRAPPFAYSTPSALIEAARLAADSASSPFPLPDPRSPVFVARRASLARLPASLALENAPAAIRHSGGRALADPGAYLHRYAEMDAQARDDLAEKVPNGAGAVLDVGCSRGATAAALRWRGVERIVGVEPDPEDASEAARRYDRVLACPLEEVPVGEFGPEFDAVLFGDVLEHLIDPSDALVRVRPWLTGRGVVIASVPNVGNWAIVADLLAGRFDYVPYSLLSGTHVRHFTRSTLRDLFEACGYAVASIDTVSVPPSPGGAAKLALFSSWPEASGDLAVAEFVVVARPMSSEREQ